MTPEEILKQPRRKETLAIKQEERVRRVQSIRNRLPEFSPQGWVRAGEVLGVTALFLTNLFLLYPFFGGEDTVNVFSAPVVPLLAGLTETLVPFSYSIRIWLLVFLLFFPLTFYYFVREISGRKMTGLVAGFLVVLPIGTFLASRVNLGLFSEDGAHIASLTFIPLVCLLLLRFLRRGNFWAGVFAAVGTTIVALTSPLGFVNLTVFMGVITFSEMLLGQGRLKFIRFLTVLFLTVGFSAFWYNPKFVFLTINSFQGQLVKQSLANLLPVSFFLVPLLGVFGFLLFENRPQLQPMFIAFFLTIAFGLFSLGAGIAHPAYYRFLPAFGVSLAFLLGLVIVGLFDFLNLSPRLKRLKIIPFPQITIGLGLISLVFIIMMIIIGSQSRELWILAQEQVLGLAVEQKVGVWEIREQTSLLENIFGLTITGLSIVSVGLIERKISKS